MVNLQFSDLAANAHFLKIKTRIVNRINTILQNGVTKDGTSHTADPDTESYLKSLKDEENLKRLITGRPLEILEIIQDLRNDLPGAFIQGDSANIILENLFIFSGYNQTAIFSKLNFIKNINIDTCPYCNRGYIYSLCAVDRIKPEIDHFYPKSIYPFLGMSFYNLIPSCSICNGLDVKANQDPAVQGLINPYLISSSDFLFSFVPRSSKIISSLLDKSSVQVSLVTKHQGHLNIFKLSELYEQHSDHVLELIYKSKIQYSETYRQYLKGFTEKGLTFSENEIDRMILGNYIDQNEIHKRPLAKLYQDIGRELGLIK